MKKNKFFQYKQNNTGGSFVTNKKLCNRIFIEAESAKCANEIAKSMGVYFDGVDNEIDCQCCGDRWYHPDEVKFPMKYSEKQTFKTVVEYAQYSANTYGWTKPDARIFYKNRKIVEIFKK